MTITPAPALTAVLDELDELRAKATVRFPWRQDSGYGEDVITADGVQFGVSGEPADAALIVAAVNHLPELTAALRAVLALAEELDGELDSYSYPIRNGLAPSPADRIRTAITTALEAS